VIEVLDNASPMKRCSHITHQNSENTYVGGGIMDCVRLSEARGCDNLLLIVNDIEPMTPILIDEFESAIEREPGLIQVAASVTHDSSPHSTIYPWMVSQSSSKLRRVPHSDLLCCIIRNSFIRSFGGFPHSRGGWGYDWEIAYHALDGKHRIAVADWCMVAHQDRLTVNDRRTRYVEMLEVYADRYPNLEFTIERIIAEHWRKGTIQMVDHEELR
jgi:hypothetical protein